VRFSDAAAQRMLDRMDESSPGGAGVGATHSSLHTAYSTTGANEVTGGAPAYARKAVTWAAASGRAKAGTLAAAFDVPAATTVRWIGFYDALTVGTFLGMTPNGGGIPEAFEANAAGVTSNTLDAPSHGFSAGNSVVVWTVPGASLPAPLAEGTVYWVIATGLTADAFQLSATSGGSALDITAVGSGMAQRIVEETFGAQGTLTVSSATLTLD
jgi:hypothetical protein